MKDYPENSFEKNITIMETDRQKEGKKGRRIICTFVEFVLPWAGNNIPG
jgi:hypothetical protein